MYLRPFVRGIATWVPGARRLFARGTGGSDDARYCYSVWLRHLVMAGRNGLNTEPRALAELGPGDSLGIGLCSVLTGVDRYHAFDVQAYANTERNARVLEALIDLLARRAPIPDEVDYPVVDPRLPSYEFPSAILTNERLARTLSPERLDRVRGALRQGAAGGIEIRYDSRWDRSAVVDSQVVDWIISQAVLEHVEDLAHTYAAMHRWLRPDGVNSACIDFRCHTHAREWNGNWAYSDAEWRVIRGNRRFLLNREPLSTHRSLLAGHGFTVVFEQARRHTGGIPRTALAGRFRHLTDEDLTTQTVFIQAVHRSPR